MDIEVLRLRPTTNVRDDFGAFLETGAYLGAEQILVTGNDPDHARLADNLAELGRFAQDFGLTANLEPMPWTDVRDLDEAALIVGRCQGSDVGLLVDAIHYDRALATTEDGRCPRNGRATSRSAMQYCRGRRPSTSCGSRAAAPGCSRVRAASTWCRCCRRCRPCLPASSAGRVESPRRGAGPRRLAGRTQRGVARGRGSAQLTA